MAPGMAAGCCASFATEAWHAPRPRPPASCRRMSSGIAGWSLPHRMPHRRIERVGTRFRSRARYPLSHHRDHRLPDTRGATAIRLDPASDWADARFSAPTCSNSINRPRRHAWRPGGNQQAPSSISALIVSDIVEERATTIPARLGSTSPVASNLARVAHLPRDRPVALDDREYLPKALGADARHRTSASDKTRTNREAKLNCARLPQVACRRGACGQSTMTVRPDLRAPRLKLRSPPWCAGNIENRLHHVRRRLLRRRPLPGTNRPPAAQSRLWPSSFASRGASTPSLKPTGTTPAPCASSSTRRNPHPRSRRLDPPPQLDSQLNDFRALYLFSTALFVFTATNEV